jgi:hypothetical protein
MLVTRACYAFGEQTDQNLSRLRNEWSFGVGMSSIMLDINIPLLEYWYSALS